MILIFSADNKTAHQSGKYLKLGSVLAAVCWRVMIPFQGRNIKNEAEQRLD